MKALFLTAVLGSLIFGAHAFALTGYDQTYTYSSPITLTRTNPSTSFSFNGIMNSFVEAPTLSLALAPYDDKNFVDELYLGIGSNKIATINRNDLQEGLYTYTFNSNTLGYLNSAIQNNAVSFTLTRNSGSSTISSATLKGTVAPEPVSMALVGAGLVGLPFARRLRKSFKQAV